MTLQVDVSKIYEKHKVKVAEIHPIVGIWEFLVVGCPIRPKVKVIKIVPWNKYMGMCSHTIQNPSQKSPYISLNMFDTVEEAIDDSISGFLKYWDPKDADKTKLEQSKFF